MATTGSEGGLLSERCPCGLPSSYDGCCGRFHRAAPGSAAEAPTAELLMRSRYSAFAVGDTAYLLQTWAVPTRPSSLVLDPGQVWTRLLVLAVERGSLLDTDGTVEFRASYDLHGRPGSMTERSRFVRDAGRWRYLGPE